MKSFKQYLKEQTEESHLDPHNYFDSNYVHIHTPSLHDYVKSLKFDETGFVPFSHRSHEDVQNATVDGLEALLNDHIPLHIKKVAHNALISAKFSPHKSVEDRATSAFYRLKDSGSLDY